MMYEEPSLNTFRIKIGISLFWQFDVCMYYFYYAIYLQIRHYL